MKNRMAGGWVAAVTVAAVLVVPCAAAAEQDFALDEQVRQVRMLRVGWTMGRATI